MRKINTMKENNTLEKLTYFVILYALAFVTFAFGCIIYDRLF